MVIAAAYDWNPAAVKCPCMMQEAPAERLAGQLLPKTNIEASARGTITDFVKYLEENQGRTSSDFLASSTIARRLSVVWSYYDWLGNDSEGTIRNPVDRVKRPKVQNSMPRAADDEVLTVLIDGITESRDRAIVLLFVYSGLRLSELRQLDKTTIIVTRKVMLDGSSQHFGYGEVLGKGNKKRLFLVGPKAMKTECSRRPVSLHPLVLDRVLEWREQSVYKEESVFLFLSIRKNGTQPLSPDSLLKRSIRPALLRAGIVDKQIGWHNFRHSLATNLSALGVDLKVAQDLLRHANSRTTLDMIFIRARFLNRNVERTRK